MSDLLRQQPVGPAALRQLLKTAREQRAPLVAPGCSDALGARLIEQAGFEAAYMTGFGTTASLLGRPDVGLLGMSEMVDNARRITAAVDLPVIADADTGYGNQINVVRCVQDYERASVAAIHIEDQILPKKCGHMDNKQVVDASVMVGKIRAAVASRQDDDFMVIARTDARAPHGMDEALRRATAYAEAGADMLFVEALQDVEEIERVATEFAGIPLLFNWVEGGKTPPLTYDEVAALGFAMIIMPIGMLLAATGAMQNFLTKLKAAGTPAPFADELMPFDDFTDLIGLREIGALEKRFSV
ncbi:MAG: oxaloacetate decarboxylase [Ilumatobacter sp.]|jgi:carboxyvinyl-carboxyphosphonate phosphorylmutase|uniref:isocitrate lyase/PEP mutase family protein n=1 Tax=uncultured Ilumatobacter sp. TaxID=879968 RepID=UPI0035905829|tara:strand:- start:126 stop:1028 length:903 start_codon:yes stop_codon:yes gene_type:complete